MLRASEKRIHLGQNLPEPELLHRRSTARWYREYVLSLVPAAYWLCDEPSGLPADVAGSGLAMTGVNGSPTYSEAGPFTNPCIGYPSGAYHERAVVSTRTNDMSVCMWVRRDGTPTNGGDIFTHGSTSGGFALEYNSTGGLVRVNLPGVGTLGNIVAGSAGLNDLTWFFLFAGKATGAGGTWSAGWNGQLGSVGTGNPGTPTGNERLNGQAATQTRLAHVAFFDRMLTQNEVSTLYQIGQKAVIPL